MSDDTEKLRLKLTKIITDAMGRESGRLFYEFHKYDEPKAVWNGARALLLEFVGPVMTDKKLAGITQP